MGEFQLIDLISAGAIALVILILGLVGLMKGGARMFFGLVALLAGAVAAYWGYQRGGAIAGYVISEPGAWMSGVVGLIMGLAIFFAARALFGVLIKPTKVQEGKKKNNPLGGAFFGFLCGIVFVWFSLSSLRYVGTLIELQWIDSALAEEGKIKTPPKPFLVTARDLVDSSLPGGFHRQYDPLNSPARAQAAKLRILTEHPYAITQVKTDAGIRAAFLQADIRNFLQKSPDLTAFIKEGKWSHLIESQTVRNLARVPAAQESLHGLKVPEALGLQAEEPEEKDKEPAKDKEPEPPADPNAPKPGSARIF